VLLSAAGCASSGDDGAAHFPTTGAATHASTGSARPTTAEQRAKAEVEATVRAYYAAMDKAIRTGDVTDFNAASTSACVCREFGSAVASVFRTGRTEQAAVDIERLRVVVVHHRVADVDAHVRTSAYRVVHDDGRVERFPAGEDHAVLGLVYVGGRWLVDSVVFLERRDSR